AWWEEIEHESLRPVPLAGQQIDAFETAEINQHLLERKLVYSAGYGQRGKAHFFLGRLEDISERRHFQIIVSSDEYARDLVSPVAMTLDRTIFLRRQALQRLLWEKVQEISWNKAETALARSLQGWDFSGNPENVLRQAAERFLSVFADHEIGEVMAGEHLGERWEDMLGSHLDSRLELQLRAVRDFLADHLSTLPHLLEEMDEQCLHFYFGMLSPIRKTVYPRLLAAYDRWRESADPEPLRQLVEERVSDWLIACEDILAAHESQSTGGQQRVADTLEQHLERINRD
ncbi:MAG: hypothetical protein KDJ38_20535, partial [Gammaproteobacteria bacterium]|nr:hypothetical protein [Gammaproteobacteria bacterium]